MSECYDGLEPDLDGHLELQKKLAKEIREGDYVVWDVLKTHTNERKERIVTFSGIEVSEPLTYNTAQIRNHLGYAQENAISCTCHASHVQRLYILEYIT